MTERGSATCPAADSEASNSLKLRDRWRHGGQLDPQSTGSPRKWNPRWRGCWICPRRSRLEMLEREFGSSSAGVEVSRGHRGCDRLRSRRWKLMTGHVHFSAVTSSRTLLDTSKSQTHAARRNQALAKASAAPAKSLFGETFLGGECGLNLKMCTSQIECAEHDGAVHVASFRCEQQGSAPHS